MAEVFLNGEAGRIEGRYTESSDKKAPVALVLHHHPLNGGTMDNKVVYNIYTTLVKQGYTVLRINFRGVGRSQGTFNKGIGELTDAGTAMDWLRQNNPFNSYSVVAGFSFGAAIGMDLIARRPEIKDFIAVSPPVDRYDFSSFLLCPIPGIILYGDQDSVVRQDQIESFVNKLTNQNKAKINCSMISGADHFFRNKMLELTQAIEGYFGLKYQQLTEEANEETELQRVFL